MPSGIESWRNPVVLVKTRTRNRRAAAPVSSWLTPRARASENRTMDESRAGPRIFRSDLISGLRRNVGDLRQDRQEFLPAAALRPLLQIVLGHQGRQLLGDGGADELIDRDAVLLRKLANPLVQGIR